MTPEQERLVEGVKLAMLNTELGQSELRDQGVGTGDMDEIACAAIGVVIEACLKQFDGVPYHAGDVVEDRIRMLNPSHARTEGSQPVHQRTDSPLSE